MEEERKKLIVQEFRVRELTVLFTHWEKLKTGYMCQVTENSFSEQAVLITAKDIPRWRQIALWGLRQMYEQLGVREKKIKKIIKKEAKKLYANQSKVQEPNSAA